MALSRPVTLVLCCRCPYSSPVLGRTGSRPTAQNPFPSLPGAGSLRLEGEAGADL